MADEPKIKKESYDGSQVDILGETYDDGKPEEPNLWRKKFPSKEEMLKYLHYSERYWSSEYQGYGSEKIKSG